MSAEDLNFVPQRDILSIDSLSPPEPYGKAPGFLRIERDATFPALSVSRREVNR